MATIQMIDSFPLDINVEELSAGLELFKKEVKIQIPEKESLSASELPPEATGAEQ